ncbi:MAG: GntR family transcriptional regulator [Candidatus Aminicenantes bacterium RBG_16_63_16]|nr:MAG: GntR family transcriptional regulator [Candidatus Aminicenantes bacterium RBG_16_63_16]
MAGEPLLQVQSLKQQVYDYLRERMRTGEISPGSEINLDETSRKLGVSRTPLRDALLQLEAEGFVTIYPRRGVVVNRLSLRDVRNLYEMIGALESAALVLSFAKLGDPEIRSLEALVAGMNKALDAGDFDLYYGKNLAFHDIYLNLCGNENLVRLVRTLKKRLYDFPRQKGFVKEWERASVEEHRALLAHISSGRKDEASAYIRDVHWSFDVQLKYIVKYYDFPPEPNPEPPGRTTP